MEFSLTVKCVQTPGGPAVLGVQGPIDNKAIALGILEEAKAAILEYHAKRAAQANSVQVPPPGIASQLVNGRKG